MPADSGRDLYPSVKVGTDYYPVCVHAQKTIELEQLLCLSVCPSVCEYNNNWHIPLNKSHMKSCEKHFCSLSKRNRTYVHHLLPHDSC